MTTDKRSMSSKAYLTIIRPANCLIASVAVAIGGLVAVGDNILQLPNLLDLVLAAIVVFLFVGAGNTLNDYYDHEVDMVNHPERPIPSGSLRRSRALAYAVALFILTFILGILINVESLLVIFLSAVIMVSYERKLKRRGLVGNLQISWLVGSLFLFGGLSVYDQEIEAIIKVSILTLLALLATLGREITKDIEDVKGDEDRMTLPMAFGVAESAYFARVAYGIAILLSIALYPAGVFGILYLGVVVVANAVFIATMALVLRSPALSSDISKVAMVMALAAFFVGAITT